MQLPGGYLENDRLERYAEFAPLTGEVELFIAESNVKTSNLPACISQVLHRSLAYIGEQKPTCDVTDDLCVGDRQYLMLQLAIRLNMDEQWYTGVCRDCHKHFDFALKLSNLPVQAAGPDFPFMTVDTSMGTCKFRVPTGRDQMVINTTTDKTKAVQLLLQSCLIELLNNNGETIVPDELVFSDNDVKQINQAFEQVAPQLPASIQAVCPYCDYQHDYPVNPYVCLQLDNQALLADIHSLAFYYHWQEKAILKMPSLRRKHYCQLLEQRRGIYT